MTDKENHIHFEYDEHGGTCAIYEKDNNDDIEVYVDGDYICIDRSALKFLLPYLINFAKTGKISGN